MVSINAHDEEESETPLDAQDEEALTRKNPLLDSQGKREVKK